MEQSPNLLDEAIGDDLAASNGVVVLIEDCVETTGAFVLHHLIKRSLSPHSSALLIFVAFAQPFSNYDRILRKMGCNLVVQRDNKRLLFFDMLMLECRGENINYQGCSFILLSHEDIYSATDRATLILQMEYLADVLVKAEPLATGLATDVHG